MRQAMIQLASELSAESAFLEPELLKGGESTVTSFVASEPRLKILRPLPVGCVPPRRPYAERF
jgi:hypothetical protein